jgi:hypothetical protein
MVNLKKVKRLVSKFIDDNESEFEFYIDLDNDLYWRIDFEDKSINIVECCNVYIRKDDDKELDEMLRDGEIGEKIEDDEFIYYIIM